MGATVTTPRSTWEFLLSNTFFFVSPASINLIKEECAREELAVGARALDECQVSFRNVSWCHRCVTQAHSESAASISIHVRVPCCQLLKDHLLLGRHLLRLGDLVEAATDLERGTRLEDKLLDRGLSVDPKSLEPPRSYSVGGGSSESALPAEDQIACPLEVAVVAALVNQLLLKRLDLFLRVLRVREHHHGVGDVRELIECNQLAKVGDLVVEEFGPRGGVCRNLHSDNLDPRAPKSLEFFPPILGRTTVPWTVRDVVANDHQHLLGRGPPREYCRERHRLFVGFAIVPAVGPGGKRFNYVFANRRLV
eukprot:m.42319 g.42319  ORF g.42319 m.42319 type:complete len:309 (-) comp8309_c0_seq1:600-1526(-)